MKKRVPGQKSIWERWLPVLTMAVVFLTMFALACIIAQKENNDIVAHTQEANLFFEGSRGASNPGFYLIYGLFSCLLQLPDLTAAAAAMALCALLCALVVYAVTSRIMGEALGTAGKCLVVLFMHFFGPLWFPAFEGAYMIGQGTFNVWHNPTNTAVKFLAVAVFFLFVRSFHMGEDEKLTLLGKQIGKRGVDALLCVGTTLSLVIKPSFFQVFAPTLAIIFVLDFLTARRSLVRYVREGILYVPAAAIILWQTVSIFFTGGNEESGMEIAFLEVWEAQSPNVALSILAVAAFPLFVAIFCEKNLFKNKMLLYALIFYVVAVLEAALLAEVGWRRYHGNFFWGMNLSIGIVFLAAILTFLRYRHAHKGDRKWHVRVKRLIGSILLLLHFGEGLAYYLVLLVYPAQCF